MKRLLLITSEFPPGPGGIGQHAASLTVTLARHHQVDILCNQDYATQDEIKSYSEKLPALVNIYLFAARSKSFSSIRRIRQAFQMTSKQNYDFIIVSGLFPLWLGAFLSYFKSVKVHAFIHGNEVNSKKLLKRLVTKKACRRLSFLYPVSSFTRDLLPVPRTGQVVKIIPNGLDQYFFSEVSELSKKSVFPLRGKPALLTVGNVTLRKGQHRVIRSLPKILKEYPEAHYHIVGLPTKKDDFLSLARELKVDHAITFHGTLTGRSSLFKIIQGADIFIMLSENQPDGDVEGFGIAILEANAFGVPAIGAKGCGIEDAISVENGVLIDGNSPDEISEAIGQLLSAREQYRTGAVKWAKKHNWRELVGMMGE